MSVASVTVFIADWIDGGLVTYYQIELFQKCVSSSGLTGHTEVVRVVFSPQEITLEELLKHFWEKHDPTQGNSTLTLNTLKKRPALGGTMVY